MAHDEDYEIPPSRLGRSSPRRAFAAGAVVVAFLGLAIVKPWAGTTPPDRPSTATETETLTARPEASTPGPAATPASVSRPMIVPPPPEPGWPAEAGVANAGQGGATQAAVALGFLAVHSGTWGVGNVGVGPRMLRDEPWYDWTAVVPEASTETPGRIATWPDTSLCAGYPTIYDRPSVVAVTAPTDFGPDLRLVGWWTDGGNVASLAGSIRQAPSAGDTGIAYLERVDRAPWPPGRYEFHVIAGERTVALTVCLTRRG